MVPPIKQTAQWYIRPAAAAIRGVGKSTILWASAASQLMLELTTEAAAIVQRGEVLICKHGGVILIPGRLDAISGPGGGGCSPHLPWMWLFQHCSSSGSTTLAALQMLSGRSDQNRFDSPSFPMTSTTCNRNQRDTIAVVPHLKNNPHRSDPTVGWIGSKQSPVQQCQWATD